MNNDEIIKFLKEYDGPKISIMEVCGTHTASISEYGIPSVISDKINLISGPGCPVCVTVASYIDKLCDLAKEPDTTIATFSDMIRVPGSVNSLQDMKAQCCKVEMLYTPFDIINLAKQNPNSNFIFAAVGFETTTPIYALLIEELINQNINNVKLLTSIKTMPPAIEHLCSSGADIDGFIAPGNVSVITGYKIYESLAEKYNIPFAVSGFNSTQVLGAIYTLVKLKDKGKVVNIYTSAVTHNGNIKAQNKVKQYFTPTDSAWRGMGIIKNSGLILKDEYKKFDAGSENLNDDNTKNSPCRCAEIITGKITPTKCPLFKKVCTPENPQGACMVSGEGTCFNYFINNRA